MKHRFSQVDVFSAEALLGNALAVVHDADGLSDERMAAFARWTQLSETTFLLPPTDPGADYRVRIFTPGGELPFAGHPTLGSCHAWLAAGGRPRSEHEVVQQCAVGLVRVRRDGTRLAFAAPPTKIEPVEPDMQAKVCAALGLDAARVRDAAWLTTGPRLMALLLDSAQTVLALKPDHSALKTLSKVGVIGAHPDGSECQFEVRFFVSPMGIDEDPVTGVLNAGLAQWLMPDGRVPTHYTAAQGAALGRAGRVHVRRDSEAIWIGGDVVACIDGHVEL